MSDIDTVEGRAELRRLAEAATPGPWEIYRRENSIVRDSDGRPTIQPSWVADVDVDHPNAAYIAAANPQTVIALLAEVERIRGLWRMDLDVLIERDNANRARAESAEAERDELGKAAFAAYVNSGADTDGAQNWEQLFRPITYPTWTEFVKDAVQQLQRDYDELDAEMEAVEKERDRLRAAVDAARASYDPSMDEDRAHPAMQEYAAGYRARDKQVRAALDAHTARGDAHGTPDGQEGTEGRNGAESAPCACCDGAGQEIKP